MKISTCGIRLVLKRFEILEHLGIRGAQPVSPAMEKREYGLKVSSLLS